MKTVLELVNGITDNGIFTISPEEDLDRLVNREDVIKIICNTCGSHRTMPIMNYKTKNGCKDCAIKKMVTPFAEVVRRIEASGKFRVVTDATIHTGKRSYMAIECVNCRMITVGKAANFYNYKCCKNCGEKAIGDKRKPLPVEYYTCKTDKLNKKLVRFLDAKYNGSLTNCLWKCAVCGVEWSCLLGESTRRHGCPGCNKSNMSKYHTINMESSTNRLKTQGVTVERWLEEYTGNSTRALLNCDKCGYVWTSKINQIKSNYSCPSCSQRKTKYLYLQRLSIDDVSIAIKFGITNNVGTRMYHQERLSVFKHDLIETYYFLDGDALRVESLIKDSFDCSFVSKDELPDGYTETVNYSELENLKCFIKNEVA